MNQQKPLINNTSGPQTFHAVFPLQDTYVRTTMS